MWNFQILLVLLIALLVELSSTNSSRDVINGRRECDPAPDLTTGDDCIYIMSLAYSEQTSSSGGCVLPKDLVNNKFCSFDFNNCSNTKWIYEPGDTVNHLVRVQCEPGHELEGGKVNQVALCLRGQWIPPIPQCHKMCPPLQSDTVTFTCSSGNAPVDCANSSVHPGTFASCKCKPDHLAPPVVAGQGTGLACSPGGLWLGTLPKCVPGKEKFENKLNSLNSVCGQTSKQTRTEQRTKRVAGVEYAELGEYPWMAAIGLRSVNVQWHCGGSLISDRYVVTAAHCLDSFPKYSNNFTVRIGGLNLGYSGGSSPVELRVASVAIHAQYNDRQKLSDIGLIKLETRVGFNDLIHPICLPPLEFRDNSIKGDTVELAVWGSQSSHGYSVKQLQKVELGITSEEDCRQKLAPFFDTFDGTRFCTLSPEKDYCLGDGGSPVMMTQDSRTFLLGIVSPDSGCWNINFPSIFIRIPQYTLWILDHMDL